MAVVGRASVLVTPSFAGMQQTVGKQMRSAMVPAGKSAGAASGAAAAASIAAPIGGGGVIGKAFGRLRSLGGAAAGKIGGAFKTQAATAAKSVGAIQSPLKSMMKTASAVAVAVGIGKLAKAGWDTAKAFDSANASLTGLLGSGKQAKQVTDWVQQLHSPIDPTSMLQFSQTLAYLGLNAQDSTKLMDKFNTAIIGSGGGAKELQSANDGLTRLINQGKPTQDVLDQISGSGMPVWSMIANKYKTDIPAVRKMVTDGALSIDDVMDAMSNGTSASFKAQTNAMEEAKKTWAYQWPAFVNDTKKAVAGIIGPLQQQLTPVLMKLAPKFTAALSGLPKAFANLKSDLVNAGVMDAVKVFGDGLVSVAKGAGPGLKAAFSGMATAFGTAALALKPIGAMLKVVGDWMQKHTSVVSAIGAAIGGFAGTLITLVGAIKLVTTAITVVNAVMAFAAANPIVLIIAGVAALVAGLIYAYKHSETFRKIVQGAFNGVKIAVQAVVGWFKNSFVPFFTKTIPNAFNAVVNFVKTNWQVIAGLILLPFGGAALIIFKYRDQILGVFKKILGYVSGAFKAGWSKLSGIITAPFKLAIDTVKLFFGSITGKGANVELPWMNTIIDAGATVRTVFDKCVAAGKTFLAGVRTVFSKVGAAFATVGKTFRTIYNGWISPVIQLFAAIVKWLVTKYIQVYALAIRTAWKAMGSLIRSVYNSVIKPIVNAFAAVVKWLWGKVLKPQFVAIRSGFHAVGSLIKSTYNSVIKPIINAFANIGRWLWNKVLKPAFNSIKSGFHNLGVGIKSTYNTVIKTIVNAFASAARWLWNKALKPAFNSIKNAWHALATGIKSIYNGTIKVILSAFGKATGAAKNVASKAFGGVRSAWSSTSKHLSNVFHGAMTKTFSAFKKAGGGMKSAFGTAVSGIGTAWSKLEGLAKKPIAFVINTVINKHLIGGFNKLADMFHTSHMKPLPAFADGGIAFPGRYTPGRDIGYAQVSGGEPIMRPEFGRAVGEPWVNAANRAARTGGVAGAKAFMAAQNYGAYASGGIVKPTKSGRQNPSYPGHSGIDFYGRDGDPIIAATAGRITYTGSGRGYGNAIFEQAANGLQMVYGHTSAILAKVGQQVKAGQQIGRVGHTGNVRPPGPAGAHLHFEIAPGGGFAQASNRDATQKWLGGSGIVGKIIGAIKGAAGALSDFDPSILLKGAVTKAIGAAKWLTESPFGQLAAKAPVVLAERAVKYAKDKFAAFFTGDDPSVSGANWSGAKVGSWNGEQLNNAATIISVAKKLGFGDKGALIGLMTAMQEATLRNLSGGDRDSVGLFQQRAPWGPFSARHNPAQAAKMFYLGGQGGQPGLKSKNWRGLPPGVAAQQVQVSAYPDAYNKWQGQAAALVAKFGAKGGYARGTNNATAGLHAIAEHGPELVMSRQTRLFAGGEQVATAGQTANLLGGPQQLVGHLKITGDDGYIEGVIERTAKKAAVSF